MKDKLSRFWMLFIRSFRTVKADKVLLKLPLVAGFAILLLILLVLAGAVLTALALAPELFSGIDEEWGQRIVIIDSPLKLAIYSISYWLFMFATYFCCVAFVSQVYQSVRQQPTGVRQGFVFALGRIDAILFWSLLVSAVGIALNVIQQQCNLPITMTTKLMGMAWFFACYFDIACITADPTVSSPLQVLRRSVTALKQAWGEALLGLVGFYLLSVSAIFTGAIFCSILFFIGMAVKILLWPAILLVVLIMLALLCFVFLIAAWDQTYQGLLYLHARGQLPGDEAAPQNNEALPEE